MVKNILKANESILPNSREMTVLRENFPSCFKADGSFDMERFKEFLNDKVAVSGEGYELKFLGKNYARLLASLDSTCVIVPDEEHNNRAENKDSCNIYISGDNLDGLKELMKSYAKPWLFSLLMIFLPTAEVTMAKVHIFFVPLNPY